MGREGGCRNSPTTVPHPITQGLNERSTALHSLERLQEEVEKLWMELHASNGESVPMVCWFARVTTQV